MNIQRMVCPHEADYEQILRMVFFHKAVSWNAGGLLDPLRGGPPSEREVLVVGAYRRRSLVTGCAAFIMPGRSVLVLLPRGVRRPAEADHLSAALNLIRAAAAERSVVLLQALVEQETATEQAVLRGAGFRRLTTLEYLERDCRTPESSPPPTDIDWIAYREDRRELFAAALERTYPDTQDCPELVGLRSASEILAGHKATGVFDDRLWWLAARACEPVGVVLLARSFDPRMLEVTYLGVAQPARGTGVGDALVHRAVALCTVFGANILTLAVDARNQQALRLYGRWDFRTMAQRAAWIATLDFSRS